MSKMKSVRKPPLAKSPIRLRPRQAVRSNTTQTPPGSLTKSQKLNRTWDMEESELCPDYRSISCELQALAKMVEEELGNNGGTQKAGFGYGVTTSPCVSSCSVFERGRFYEEYSARRNERLKRKYGEDHQGKTTYNLGVTVESAKRGATSRKRESFRKSISAAYSTCDTQAPRYMLRSMSKENKKPPLAASASLLSQKSAAETKVRACRVRNI